MRHFIGAIVAVVAVLGLSVSAFGGIHYTVSNLNNVPGRLGVYGLSEFSLTGMCAETGFQGQVLINGVLTDLDTLIPGGTGWDLQAALSVDNSTKQIIGTGIVGGSSAPFLLTLAGDADADGIINGSDLSVWQRNYNPLGASGNGYWTGDWTGDGRVDGSDLALWQQNYSPLGATFSLELAGQDQAPPAVPEPLSLSLLVVSVGLVTPRIRRAFKRS